ncbi:MAG: FGGY-family carbohydrate kinase [Oscillospiraceae bacterium]|jgi:xylulokinase|nr:FGGY-family carbohydrate kinase [Oscillospiraceae bacterium]
MQYIISYDLGTGGTKASLFDLDGRSLAAAFVPCDTYYPASGFHEQKPEEWWGSVVRATRDLLQKTTVRLNDVACLAVSGHSLGVVPVGYDGSLLSERVPIWTDSRAGKEAKEFFETIPEEAWYMTTGNGFPPPLYAVFKLMWYRRHFPELFAGTDKFVGTKDYINYKMTGVLSCDYSYASGSGVYDLKGWKYKPEYIAASEIPADKFPEIVPSTEIIGTLTKAASEQLGLPRSVQVACGGVDNACMALGAGCIRDGMAYTSLGTSAWIAVTSARPVLDVRKRPYVFAHCVPGMFTSATATFSAGNSYRWLRDTVCDELAAAERISAEDAYAAMDRLAAASPVGAKKLLFNPSLAGGSSLDRSSNIRGAFLGIDLGHTKADLIRATLEGICLNLRIALDVLEKYTRLSEDMLVVGGGGKSRFWRGLFADIYNKNIIETNIGQDTGSLGAAAVAAVGAGLWKSFDRISEIHKVRDVVRPDGAHVDQYEKILRVFEKASDMQCDIGDMLAAL